MTTAAEHEERIKAMEWSDLRSLWQNIRNRNTPNWPSGKAFEYLVIRAFECGGAQVRYPYNVWLFNANIEQIDGAVHCEGLSCLVESKDFDENAANNNVNITPIAKLRNQLLHRPASTIGLVFSRTAFTPPALKSCHFLAPQTILLWNGNEIEYALEEESICEMLTLKYRACVEYGLPDYDVREELIQ